MGFFSSVESWFTGVDLDQQQAISDQTDAANQAISQQLLENGTLTQAQYDQTQTDMAAGNANTGDDNVVAAVGEQAAVGATEILYDPGQWWDDTKQGADDAAQAAATAAGKLTAGIGDYIKAYLQQLWKNIPWYVWALLALLLAGGLWLLYRKVKSVV